MNWYFSGWAEEKNTKLILLTEMNKLKCILYFDNQERQEQKI